MAPLLAKLTHFVLLVLLYLVQGTLVALNITRIFLMLKVKILPSDSVMGPSLRLRDSFVKSSLMLSAGHLSSPFSPVR